MPATRERNLDLDFRDGFEWRSQSSLRGRRRKVVGGGGDIIREGGGSGRKGEEGSHAGLPTPFYNYAECKLRNTNLCPIRAFDFSLDCHVSNSDQS